MFAVELWARGPHGAAGSVVESGYAGAVDPARALGEAQLAGATAIAVACDAAGRASFGSSARSPEVGAVASPQNHVAPASSSTLESLAPGDVETTLELTVTRARPSGHRSAPT